MSSIPYLVTAAYFSLGSYHRFVKFNYYAIPELLMEYLPLVNLTSVAREKKITPEGFRQVFLQSSKALEYLHSRENPLTHWEFKPENILVSNRSSHFHIKLSDFRLTKDDSDSESIVGHLATWLQKYMTLKGNGDQPQNPIVPKLISDL